MNAVIAAARADGKVLLKSVASEPEITNFVAFMQTIGVTVEWPGDHALRINGSKNVFTNMLCRGIILWLSWWLEHFISPFPLSRQMAIMVVKLIVCDCRYLLLPEHIDPLYEITACDDSILDDGDTTLVLSIDECGSDFPVYRSHVKLY